MYFLCKEGYMGVKPTPQLQPSVHEQAEAEGLPLRQDEDMYERGSQHKYKQIQTELESNHDSFTTSISKQ